MLSRLLKQPLLLMFGSSSSPPKLSVFLGELWLSDEDLDRMKRDMGNAF